MTALLTVSFLACLVRISSILASTVQTFESNFCLVDANLFVSRFLFSSTISFFSLLFLSFFEFPLDAHCEACCNYNQDDTQEGSVGNPGDCDCDQRQNA